MYSKESKSERDSMEAIAWTALGVVAFILLYSIGRSIYDNLNEGATFGYIGLTFLFIGVSCVCIKIFFGIKNSIKKSQGEKTGPP